MVNDDLSDLKEIVFQSLYDSCNLPEHRCREIMEKVIAALQVWADKEVEASDHTG